MIIGEGMIGCFIETEINFNGWCKHVFQRKLDTVISLMIYLMERGKERDTGLDIQKFVSSNFQVTWMINTVTIIVTFQRIQRIMMSLMLWN